MNCRGIAANSGEMGSGTSGSVKRSVAPGRLVGPIGGPGHGDGDAGQVAMSVPRSHVSQSFKAARRLVRESEVKSRVVDCGTRGKPSIAGSESHDVLPGGEARRP